MDYKEWFDKLCEMHEEKRKENTMEELKKIYKEIDCASYIACNQNNDSCEDCPYDLRKGCIFDEIKEDMERLIIDAKCGEKL